MPSRRASKEAIREGTPIVVMWEFPPSRSEPPAQRPYRLRIVERSQEEASMLAPLWIQQDAAGLQEPSLRADVPLVTDALRPFAPHMKDRFVIGADHALRTLTARRRFNAGLMSAFGIVGLPIGVPASTR